MDRFVLGNTDFAVDRSASSVQVAPDGLVTVVVCGTDEAVDAQRDTDPFSWAIHPPTLYVTAVPATWTGDVATVRIDEAVSDLYDVGLYLHEHGDVIVELTLDRARALHISGSAQVSGHAEPIDIKVGLPLLPS
ncbi:hypothetical protein ACIP4W_37905 [Streptomyces sp. NPDC088846]|uniref:hypothetical protein n=1 Tax=Streptomyces sp. NPDC088846 TaxID=3365908 RepID=UPI0037F9DDAE